jgi:hypothetical protein
VRRLIYVIAAATAASSGCLSAEPLYRTASERIEQYGLDDGYTFIAPYFTRVETTLWISIAKASTSSQNSQSSENSGSQNKAVGPSIFFAAWQSAGADSGEIRYAVSCDLSKVLKGGETISVTGVKPEDTYSGRKIVTRSDAGNVFVRANATKPDSDAQPVGGTLNTSCPQPAAAPSLSITFGVTTTPAARGYLYLKRNAFFSDSVNVSVDINGLLSGSDSSSTQQITSILTELAQVAGQIGAGGFPGFAADLKKGPQDPRQRCFTALAELIKPGPYYVNYAYGSRWSPPTAWSDPGVRLAFKLAPLAAWTGPARFDHAVQVAAANGRTKVVRWHDGLLAFYPVPAKATLACIVTTPGAHPTSDTIFLSAPSIINLYTSSQFVDPQRDFLTGPQDTFTFNAGMIVGHKYGSQSAAKTVVDTITAPIRALIPSVSVQQSTQVQTGGGKADQTTTTTQTTTGAPKSP